jgi:GST-like protein
MIDLYTWLTPNGRKVSLMLEETGLPYRAHAINIGKGDQFGAEFSEICPNNKIPAIVDHEGPSGATITLFESGAILQYLAEKSGQLLSHDPATRWRTLQWLYFQAASMGPMLGQAQHFLRYADVEVPYAIDRYGREAVRLYGVLDRALDRTAYLAGDAYSIADVATWPWVRAWKIQGVDIAAYPNVARWLATIDARPAVARERAVLAEHRHAPSAPLEAAARDHLFGMPADRPAQFGAAEG